MGRCFFCLCCFCMYPCVPYRGGGGYPNALQELEDFTSTQASLDQDNLSAYHELQSVRITHQEPIGLHWEDAVETLETGDLVLFKGSGIGSVLITTFTGRWSHVGMVYTRTFESSKVILLWESVSHSDECVDVPTQTYKDGVRLVDLRRRLLASDSPFFGIVKLKMPQKLRRVVQARFEEFRQTELSKPYEPNRMNLIRVALDCGALGHNERTKDSYFCSKLVGETFIHMGVAKATTNPALICPTDFWDYNLLLHNNCRVQALILIPRLKGDPPGLRAGGDPRTQSNAELEQLLIEHDTTLRSPLLRPPVQMFRDRELPASLREDRKKRKKSADVYKLH
jgi:hypothetical protein